MTECIDIWMSEWVSNITLPLNLARFSDNLLAFDRSLQSFFLPF